jgi:hypothetical protein
MRIKRDSRVVRHRRKGRIRKTVLLPSWEESGFDKEIVRKDQRISRRNTLQKRAKTYAIHRHPFFICAEQVSKQR